MAPPISITNIPMTNPEIVTGVSLALLFAFICHAGMMILLKKVRQKWAMDDLEKRRKRAGNKAKGRSAHKTRKRMK